MKNILLISFFNSNNIGDVAIAQTLVDELSAFANVVTLDISGNPPRPSTVSNASFVLKKRAKFYTLRYFVSLRKKHRFDYAKSLICNCDFVLIAGGNMIMDLEHYSYYSFLCDKYIKFSQKAHKKVAVAFVGVGKIRTIIQRLRWKYALSKCSFISVRDSLSKKSLADQLHLHKEVNVWKDPVFGIENQKNAESPATVAINIYLGAANSPIVRSKLIETYAYLINELKCKYDIVLFTTEAMDNIGLNEIYNMIPDKSRITVKIPNSLQELLDLYNKTSVVIATRMHAFIIANSQNIPSIILAWNKKIDGVLQDINLSNYVYDIYKETAPKENILRQVIQLVENNKTYVESLKNKNKKIKNDLKEYFHIIKKLMED